MFCNRKVVFTCVTGCYRGDGAYQVLILLYALFELYFLIHRGRVSIYVSWEMLTDKIPTYFPWCVRYFDYNWGRLKHLDLLLGSEPTLAGRCILDTSVCLVHVNPVIHDSYFYTSLQKFEYTSKFPLNSVERVRQKMAANECSEYLWMPPKCLEIYFWPAHVKANN